MRTFIAGFSATSRRIYYGLSRKRPSEVIGSLFGFFLDFASARHPDKLALVFKNNRWTYRQLRERVLRLSSALLGLGLKKGDRVATAMWNCSEILEIYLAAVGDKRGRTSRRD